MVKWSARGRSSGEFDPDPRQLLGEIGGSFPSTVTKDWPQTDISALMTIVQSIRIEPKPFLPVKSCSIYIQINREYNFCICEEKEKKSG